MAKHADASGSLALSPIPRDTVHPLPRKLAGSPPFSGSNPLPRPIIQPAEIAQARVFERLLQAESADLRELAQRVLADDDQQPGELTQIRARIDEVDGLLRALQGRFLHSAPGVAP